jgi:hypothetical protein
MEHLAEFDPVYGRLYPACAKSTNIDVEAGRLRWFEGLRSSQGTFRLMCASHGRST